MEKQGPLNFTLVKTAPRYRVYRSDKEITKFPRKSFNWEEELELGKKKLMPGVEMLQDKCFFIVISDASTHTERLVFAGMEFRKPDGTVDYGYVSSLHIDGRMTMMIDGGDASSVKDDSIYLRHISIVNSRK